MAVALELGIPPAEILNRLGNLPGAPHRLEAATAEGGFLVLDDTYNANPAGAAASYRKVLGEVPGQIDASILLAALLRGPLSDHQEASAVIEASRARDNAAP